MKDLFEIFIAAILIFLVSAVAHDADTVTNCAKDGETTLLLGTKIKCEVTK